VLRIVHDESQAVVWPPVMLYHLASDQRKNPDHRVPVYAQREVVVRLLDSKVDGFWPLQRLAISVS
jgi:hypothetical protein